VAAAVREWDAGLAAAVRYGRCRRGAVCITVRQGPSADSETAGSTTGRAVVLNGFYSGTDYRFRLTVLCHELGHALGLGHTRDRDSCMQAVVDSAPPHPGRRDFAKLNRESG
jgi:hypothetical protein